MDHTRNIRPIGRNALLAIGGTIVTFSVVVSFFFARESERFFWEARTRTVTQEVTEVSERIFKENYIATWTNASSTPHIEAFATGVKREIPSIVAVKIFTTDAILVWSDLKNENIGAIETDLTALDPTLRKTGIAIEDAGVDAKLATNKENLLEIYSVIKNNEGEIIGFIECYFDSSDIRTFINKTRIAILGTIIVAIFIIIFFLRIALRQQSDIILRQAYELSNLVDQSPVGIYTINTKGKILSINPKMLALIGESDDANIVGKTIWDIKNIMKMDVEKSMREALQGTAFDKELSGVDESGAEVFHHYRGTPVMSSDGKTVEQVLFIVEDITDHKQLEQAVAKHTKDLEEGVNARTKELQDKIAELEQFQKLTVGREIRMTELKQELEEMEKKIAILENKNTHQ